MYACDFAWGVRGNVALKHREQDYVNSNQDWVCKFEKMGWDMLLRKIYCALPHKLVWRGCSCNSIKNGAERYAGMLLCKTRNVFG